MSDGVVTGLLFGGKALCYGWLFAIPRLWLPKNERPSLLTPCIAAAVRLILGIALGTLVGAFSLRHGPEMAIAILSGFRLALWMSVTGLAYPKLPWTANALFSAGATVLNTILDFSIGHWAYANYGLC